MPKICDDFPHYPQFARLFKLALIKNKLGQEYLLSCNQNTTLKEFFCKLGGKSSPYAESLFYKACGGYLNDPQHPLNITVVKNIVMKCLGQPGFNNLGFIELMLNNGRSEYKQILKDPDFIEKTVSLDKEGKLQKMPDYFNPVPFYIPTITKKIVYREIEKEIIKKIGKTSPLYVTGKFGVGKTTLLKKLANIEFLTKYDQIIWIDLSSQEEFSNSIIFTLELLFSVDTINNNQSALLNLKRILSKVSGQKCIFLLENCHDYTLTKEVISLLPSNMSCIAEITHTEVSSLLDISGDSTIAIPTFTNEEMNGFRSTFAPKIPNDDFSTLAKMVNNIPLDLNHACGLYEEIGYQRTIDCINAGPDQSVLQKSINILDEDQKEKFYLLGLLPKLLSYNLEIITALWKCDSSSAFRILRKFSNLRIIDELHSENHWSISNNAREIINIHKYLKSNDEEYWINELDLSKRYKTAMSRMPPPSLLEFLKVKISQPKSFLKFIDRVYRQLRYSGEHSTYWQLINASSQYLSSEEWLLAKYEDIENRKFFNAMRVILGAGVLLLISSIIFSLVNHIGVFSIPLEIIWLFPIAFLVGLLVYILNPTLRKQEYYSLQLLKKFRK